MKPYRALARHYDILTSDVQYGEFLDFYEKEFSELERRPGAVLDLACGTGSLSLMLAGRGYEMISVDSSPDMLSQFRQKMEGQKLPVAPLLICQDLAELDLYGTADAAICSLDSLNYLSAEEVRKFFGRLRLFLEPGGLFIFDILNPESLRSRDGAVYVDDTDDVFCVWRAEYEDKEKRLCYGMDIFSKEGHGWQREYESHFEYPHEREDILLFLGGCGFEKIKVIETKIAAPEGRIFFVARNGLGEVQNG